MAMPITFELMNNADVETDASGMESQADVPNRGNQAYSSKKVVIVGVLAALMITGAVLVSQHKLSLQMAKTAETLNLNGDSVPGKCIVTIYADKKYDGTSTQISFPFQGKPCVCKKSRTKCPDGVCTFTPIDPGPGQKKFMKTDCSASHDLDNAPFWTEADSMKMSDGCKSVTLGDNDDCKYTGKNQGRKLSCNNDDQTYDSNDKNFKPDIEDDINAVCVQYKD